MHKYLPVLSANWQWRLFASVLVVMACVFSGTVSAQDSALEDVNADYELIRIRPAEGGEFKVQLRTEKSSYRVGERIRFEVKGNRHFYLYLFNIDPHTHKGFSILPNYYQTKHEVRYEGGHWYKVPNAKLEFYSDRAGQERILMVASTKYLDVEKLLRRGRSKSVGDFYQLDDPLGGLESVMDDAYAGGEEASQKRIQIRKHGSRLPKGLIVQEVNLRIR